MEREDDRPIINALIPLIIEFRNNPDAELEVRLGSLSSSGVFTAGVDESYSLGLHTSMTDKQSIHLWHIHPIQNFKYLFFPGDIRGRYEHGAKTKYHRIVRKRNFIVSCPSRVYALKFALKEEIPLDDNILTTESATYVKYNSRVSLEHKEGWRYDFTKVGQSETDEVARTNISHQVELELQHTPNYTDHELAILFLGLSRDMLDRYYTGQREAMQLTLK